METMMIDNKFDMSASGSTMDQNLIMIPAKKNNLSTRMINVVKEITQLLEVEETYNIVQIVRYMYNYDPFFFEKYAESVLSDDFRQAI